MSLIYLNGDNKVCLQKESNENEIELVGDFKGGQNPQWTNEGESKKIPHQPEAIDMKTGAITKIENPNS